MRLLASLLLVMFAAAPLAAQGAAAPVRQGFGISFGVGGGAASYDCDSCDEVDSETGFSGYLRIGGYVRPTLFVAGETNGWMHSEGGVDETISYLSAVVQWYPSVTNSFYLKGGVGFAGTTIEDDVDELSAAGFGFTIGTGYDWRLTRNFSLTPYVNYLRSVGAEAEFNGIGVDENLNTSLFQFGLGFTWH